MAAIQTRSSRRWLLRRHGCLCDSFTFWDRRYPYWLPNKHPGHDYPVGPKQEDVWDEILNRKYCNDPDHPTTFK